MAAEPVTIKKYANRRLYNTGTSTYVTLEDLAAMVKAGEDFIVHDAKTGEDITRQVLAQTIFEQENKEGQSLLPITFLRQLIRFYGDSMQMLVRRYLEVSIDSLTREQHKFCYKMTQAFAGSPFRALEDQVRRNTEMFERASGQPQRSRCRTSSAKQTMTVRGISGSGRQRPAALSPTAGRSSLTRGSTGVGCSGSRGRRFRSRCARRRPTCPGSCRSWS